MSEEKKETGFYDATKENKETHPVQGMVWGIVSLVIAVVSLMILIPAAHFPEPSIPGCGRLAKSPKRIWQPSIRSS
jgi:hypothetical protein